jgi:1-acyl-sn-glycerol-3-phosphate acyltransferase
MSDYLETNDKFAPPPKDIIKFIAKFATWYFDPQFVGMDKLNKDHPALYVSNHTLLGITDGPLYIPKIYEDKNIYMRVMVDNLHKSVPLWRSVLTDLGAVTGSREHATKLMNHKQHILVFPGGANEVCKTKDTAYKLDWKERYGFVRMAIENNYPIAPIASLGGDDLFDIIADKDDLKGSMLGGWLKDNGILDKYFKGGENIPPLVKGIGPTLIPKPKRIYYKFCQPIPTAQLKQDSSDKNLKAIRKLVEASIYEGLDELRALRSKEASKTEENPIRKFFNGL